MTATPAGPCPRPEPPHRLEDTLKRGGRRTAHSPGTPSLLTESPGEAGGPFPETPTPTAGTAGVVRLHLPTKPYCPSGVTHREGQVETDDEQ